jgi:hypothetical protein
MDLKKWIEGNKKDYALGVAIYEAHGGSETLLRLFKKSSSKFNQDKLTEKLQKFYEKLPANPKEKKILPTTVTSPEHSAPSKELPADLKPIHDLKLGSFKKMAAIHQQLATIKGNGPKAIESRYKMQKEILQLDELNEQCWDKIHYYEKHGKLPLDETGFYPDQLTIRELVQLEKSIPTYITKLAKDANNSELSDEVRQKLFNRKAEWHLKQQRIKQEIDALPVLSQIKKALC